MNFQNYYNPKKFDYIIENSAIDDDYFDNLFAYYPNYHPMLLKEEVELLGRNVFNRQNGYYDQYVIRLDQFLFYSYITYIGGKVFRYTINKHIREAKLKNYPILSSLQNIQKIIRANSKNTMAVITFVDGDDNTEHIGKVGHYTFSVMKGIEQSVTDSFIHNLDKNIFMIMLWVNKNEPKRLTLYSQMISRKLPRFKNEVIDWNSDPSNCIMYRY